MLDAEEKKQVESLIRDCNEMIEGKFILADSKISNILKDITKCKFIYNIMADCMSDFSFEKEFGRAKVRRHARESYFVMPTEERKILAITFCLLVQIENREIDFASFLKEYFTKDGITEYMAFTDEVMRPFRDVLIKIYESQDESYEEEKEEGEQLMNEEEEKKIYSQNEVLGKDDEDYFSDIIACSHEIIKNLMFDSKIKMNVKDDATIIAEAIIEACELKNLKLLNGLIIGFDKIAGGIKSIKFIYKELKDIIVDFYNYIQG